MVPCEQSATRRTGGRFAKLSAKRNRTRNSETTLKRGTSWVGRWCAVATMSQQNEFGAAFSVVFHWAHRSYLEVFVFTPWGRTSARHVTARTVHTRPRAPAPVVGFSKFSTGRRHYKRWLVIRRWRGGEVFHRWRQFRRRPRRRRKRPHRDVRRHRRLYFIISFRSPPFLFFFLVYAYVLRSSARRSRAASSALLLPLQTWMFGVSVWVILSSTS